MSNPVEVISPAPVTLLTLGTRRSELIGTGPVVPFVPAVPPVAPPSTLDATYVSNHLANARARLIEQYRNKPGIDALLTVICTATQAADDAAAQLFTLNDIDNSVGAQLDVIGRRIGEARQSFDDPTYRLHLKARVLLNRSSGTIPDILNLFELLLDESIQISLQEYFPAAFWVTLDGAAVDGTTLAPYIFNFLQEARNAGVRAILQWSVHAPGQTFAFAGAPGIGFDSGYWASAKG